MSDVFVSRIEYMLFEITEHFTLKELIFYKNHPEAELPRFVMPLPEWKWPHIFNKDPIVKRAHKGDLDGVIT